MNHEDVTVVLLRISCILSIFGSIVVMAVCSYSQLVDKQKGKQLIFWLSVTDFGSSAVYFTSSFESDDGKNTSLCKVYALLGIFFPVASFLWTDFIAYYLWTMIATRKIRNDDEWRLMMNYFHAVSWGLSAVCIILVGATGHAGRGTSGDSDNTGGWCWVRAEDNSRLILWELIGGKLVEWTSCLIVLPYFYYKTAGILMRLDNSWSTFLRDSSEESKPGFFGSICGMCNNMRSPFSHSEVRGHSPVRADASSAMSSTFASNSQSADSRHQPEKPSFRRSTESMASNKPKFWKFYSRMALVPVLFFLARIWGSLRIVIYAFAPDNSYATRSADGWLHTMQAIFDPSQGFLNALLFVFLSSKNMNAISAAMTTSPVYIYIRKLSIVETVFGNYVLSPKTEMKKESGSKSSAVDGMSRSLLVLSEEVESDYDSYCYEENSLTLESKQERHSAASGWTGEENDLYYK